MPMFGDVSESIVPLCYIPFSLSRPLQPPPRRHAGAEFGLGVSQHEGFLLYSELLRLSQDSGCKSLCFGGARRHVGSEGKRESERKEGDVSQGAGQHLRLVRPITSKGLRDS